MRPTIRRLTTTFAATAVVAAALVAVSSSAQAITGPPVVDFGTVPVGSSETLQWTVNTSPGYSVELFSQFGGFADWPTPDSAVLGCHGACVMSATFAPASAGPSTTHLEVAECPDGGGLCNNLPIDLKGIGGGPVANGTLVASPSSANAGSSFSAASSTPCPTGTVSPLIRLVDGDGNQLASHAGFVTGGGNWAGTVGIPANAPAGPAFVTAVCDNGHGTALGYYNYVPVTITAPAPPPPAPAAFSANPTSLQFGTLRLGQSRALAVTVTNTGGSPLTITSVSVNVGNKDFKITANNCSGVLAGGSFCQTTVTFKPTVGTPRSGTLAYTDNLGTQTVGLSGRGCALLCG